MPATSVSNGCDSLAAAARASPSLPTAACRPAPRGRSWHAGLEGWHEHSQLTAQQVCSHCHLTVLPVGCPAARAAAGELPHLQHTRLPTWRVEAVALHPSFRASVLLEAAPAGCWGVLHSAAGHPQKRCTKRCRERSTSVPASCLSAHLSQRWSAACMEQALQHLQGSAAGLGWDPAAPGWLWRQLTAAPSGWEAPAVQPSASLCTSAPEHGSVPAS